LNSSSEMLVIWRIEYSNGMSALALKLNHDQTRTENLTFLGG
jgi:hypothetical protein